MKMKSGKKVTKTIHTRDRERNQTENMQLNMNSLLHSLLYSRIASYCLWWALDEKKTIVWIGGLPFLLIFFGDLFRLVFKMRISLVIQFQLICELNNIHTRAEVHLLLLSTEFQLRIHRKKMVWCLLIRLFCSPENSIWIESGTERS